MVRISDSKPGRRDGGYTRVFDDPDIGAVISRVHATSITAGTTLEKIIERESRRNGTAVDDLDGFLASSGDGTFIVGKKVVKKAASVHFRSAEPDYVVFVRNAQDRRCFVLELKDGDAFDTKKASGEIASLSQFTREVGSRWPFSTDYRICCFNQNDKAAIVTGFKGAIGEDKVWTGREFCDLMGFDYGAIVNERKADADDNIRFFVDRLLAIPSVARITGRPGA